MRNKALAALMFVLTFGTSSADDQSGFDRLDAALTLWQMALASERADLAMAAVEVIVDVAPIGVAEWADEALVEVRFLGLGDDRILDRAAQLDVTSPKAGTRLVRLSKFTLAKDQSLGRVRPLFGADTITFKDADGRICDVVSKPVSSCESRGLRRDITIVQPAPQIWIALELLGNGPSN